MIRYKVTLNKNNINNLNKVINKFIRQIKFSIIKGSAIELYRNYVEKLTQYSVLGRVLQSLHYVQPVNKSGKQRFAYIGAGVPALLLEDAQYKSKFNYPRVVTFSEEPLLKDWVESMQALGKLKNETAEQFIQSRGLTVGKENSSYGRKKWFTNGTNDAKKGLEKSIVRELKTIKL